MFLKKVKKSIKNNINCLYIMPVILGILLFTVIPVGVSFVGSFFDYDLRYAGSGMLKNFGLQNYIKPFTADWQQFSQVLRVTFTYALIWLPLGLVLGFLLALLLNQKIKGMRFFRTIFYLPCIIPSIVYAMIWQSITDYRYGYGNAILNLLNLPSFGWFTYAETSMTSLMIMNLFTIGGGMILWISQFKNIPESLYESARMEGAGKLTLLLRITIPCSTPIIFFTFITGTIGILQTFTTVYAVTGGGGRDGSLNFFVVYIYQMAFSQFKAGYACALSWILFFIIAILTYILFKTGGWVYYGEDND